MLKFMVCCGADVNVVSPEGETLLQVLQQGLEQQEKDSQYTLAKILSYSPRSQFYKVSMPNGDVHEYSSTLVDHQRKWVKKGHVYVHTPSRKDDFMFIKNRFVNCQKYIEGKQAFDEKKRTKRPKKKRLLLKSHAVRILQGWWRTKLKRSSRIVASSSTRPFTWDRFAQGELLPMEVTEAEAEAFLRRLIQEGKMADFHRFKQRLVAKEDTVYHRLLRSHPVIREHAQEDCPMLLSL
jgi:hypothetical protein